MTNKMISTYYEFDDPRLPADVISLEQAVNQTDNQILKDGLRESIKNGYFLVQVEDWGYVLERLEVEE
jgi:hypothetical protein